MLIPRESGTFVRLEIYNEFLRVRVNKNSRYSFLKKSVLRDLGTWVINPEVKIRVSCNGICKAADFIVGEDLKDALLGTNFLHEFEVNHQV